MPGEPELFGESGHPGSLSTEGGHSVTHRHGDDPEGPVDEEHAGDAGEEPENDDDFVRRYFDEWRRRSALGAIGTAYARALQGIFSPSENEPVAVAEAPGEPPDADQYIRVRLDPDDPTKSVAYIPRDQGKPPKD